MSSKGGLNHQKNGGALLGTHGITVLLQNNENISEIRGKTVLLEQQTDGNSVLGIQDGGSLVDIPKSIGYEHLIADHSENDNTEDGLASLGNSLSGSGIEWIKASVDDMGRVTYDLVNTGALLGQGDILQTSDNKGSVISVIQDPFDSSPEVHIDSVGATSVCPTGTIAISNIHQLCPDVSVTTTSALSPELSKNVDSANTLTQSSPCSPTNFLELPQVGKPRRYSEGTESLSVQDRACLEELERGSQLTAEEREMLENSKKELAALEYQSFPDKSSSLLSPPELESLSENGGLDFVQVVPLKETSTSLVSATVCDIDTLVSKSLSNSPSYTLLSNNSVISTASLSELSSQNNDNVLNQTQIVPTAISTATPSTVESNQQDAATISITTDKSSEMTQIILTTSQGQQVFHINHADLAASIQGNTGVTQANPVLHPTTVIQDPPKLGANGTVAAQVQEGFLVIPFAPNGHEEQADATTGEGPGGDADSHLARQKALKSRTNVPSTAVKWVCSVCDQGFTKLSKLKVHSMSHTGERPFKCSTPGCDWAFTTAYKLKRHEESHQGKKEFLCDAEGCGRKFTTIYNLNTHKKLHERPCTEMCPESDCGECYPTKRLLDQHMRIHGNSTKSYECPHPGCDRKFYSQYCMGSHMRVHQRSTDLVCPFEGCNKKFDKMCRLKQHTRSHTGERPYECPADGCSWAFSTSSKLRRHVQKHTGERKWTCPHKECGKAFMRMEHLKGHMITHSGQKPFECPIEGCNARFKAKSSMYVHAKKHLHDKFDGRAQKLKDMRITYYCPLEGCNKKYNSKGALRQHIEKHYQKQQIQSTLGDLIPLLNVEDLESLVQIQAETSSGIPGAHTDSVLTSECVSIANQAETITTVEQQAILSGTIVSLPDDVSQSLVAQSLGVSASANLPIYLSQVKQEIVGEQIGASIPATSLLSSSQTVQLSEKLETSGVLIENGSGSARTDYRSNHILSHRAKKRRQLLKEKSTLDLGSISEFSLSRPDLDSETSTGSSSAPVVNPNEIMTSRAITFRDPETGAIYVQTQLLQDDPPDPDYSGEDSLDGTDQSGLSTNLASLLHDGHSVDLGSPPSGVEFTGTTINLQDLE